MRRRLLLVCLGLVGCASKLDFDSVSARYGEDAATGDAGPLDSGVQDAEAAPEDAVNDASAAEGPVSDASTQQEPTQFSCARVSPPAVFCDDFENEALLDRWGDRTVFPLDPLAGTIEHDSTARRAGKSSLLAVLHAGSQAPCEGCLFAVGVGKSLPDLSLPARVTIEFDLRVDQVASLAQRRVMLMGFILGRDDYGFTSHTLQLQSGSDPTLVSMGFIEFDADGIAQDANLDELPPVMVTEHPLLPVLDLRVWSHFKYVLDGVGGSSAVATLTLDDKSLYDGPLNSTPQTANPRLELGIPDVNFLDLQEGEATEEWRVRFDNVLVRAESIQ